VWLYMFKSQFISVTKKVLTKDVIIIKGVYYSMILSFTLYSIKFFHFANLKVWRQSGGDEKGPEVKVTLWISLSYVNGIEIAGPLRIEICDFSRLWYDKLVVERRSLLLMFAWSHKNVHLGSSSIDYYFFFPLGSKTFCK
jgi:hypothetical protein